MSHSDFGDTKISGARLTSNLDTSPNCGMNNIELKLRRRRPLRDTKTSASNITDMMNTIKLRPSNLSSLCKQEHSPQTSEMPVGISSLKPERDSKKQNISKIIRWSDFPDEKHKTSESIRHLNIIPSGMIFKSDNRLVTSNVSAGASKRNTTPTELKNMETSKRSSTVGCNFVQWRKCNSNTLFEIETKAKFASLPNPKNIKPPLLFKTETEINKDAIKSYKYINPAATETEHAILPPKVLIHGVNIPSPVKSIMDVPFHSNIHKALQSFQHSTSIQSFVWPALMRHMNVCMVSPPKSGKTMAYLPAICSYLLERDERYKDLPQNYVAPIAIILCPGIEIAEQVFSCVCNITQNIMNKPVPALAIPPMNKRCLNQFYKQCDILVATPMTLVDLEHARIISFKRLCHLVIENADTILEKFPQEMNILFRLIQIKLSYRTCYNTVLLVASAEHWTRLLKNLMKRLNSTPMICIESDFEAAVYGRVQLNMDFQESEDKMPKLANILQNEANKRKTVVIFNTDEEIEVVKEYLLISGVQSIIIYDAMEEKEILGCEMRWLNSVDGKHLPLLCTDKIYNCSLHISNAVHLIHFSLPKTWAQFVSRFRCMQDNYNSPLTVEEPSIQTSCSVDIFVDKSCTKQFPKLMEVALRMVVDMGVDMLAPNVIEIYKAYTRTIQKKEKQKVVSRIEICQNLKLFGECFMVTCKKRHMLSNSEIDRPAHLPNCGFIKFKILHMQDVISMTVKLLQHTDSEGKTKNFKTYDSLQDDLQKVMTEHRICVFDAKPGQWYAWHSLENQCFYRCVVEKILKHEKMTQKATDVTVCLLDTGERMNVTTSFLYELPDEFHKISAIGVDLILANMVPLEQDTVWSSDSKSQIINNLHEAGCYNENTYGVSQILLQLGNILWVKNIQFFEDLSVTNVTVTKLNVRKTLQDQNLISNCENQLEELYKLCKNAHIELPYYSLPVRGKSEEQVQPQWAYFENTDFSKVCITTLYSPSLFYVRLMKFYGLFENLLKDIQEVIAKPFYPSKFEVQVDKYYLAKHPESDNFCRVKILEIKEDMVEVFYVDYGNSATVNMANLKYLSNELIEKLPFQAIECRLYGINPALEDWQPKAIDIVYRYIFEPNTDIYRTLYTATRKQEPALRTGGQKCAILLLFTFKGKPILLNQFLIDCGQAMTVKNEDLDASLKVPQPEKCVDEEEPDCDIGW